MIKRIAIIGPESTGKSELAQQLAREYESEWVPEFARFYIDRLDRDYGYEDLKIIAEGQMTWENDKAEYANEYLFCDTNLIVIKVWSDFKFGKTDAWIEEQILNHNYDHILLCDIDIPWKPDPQREHPQSRKEIFDIYKNYLGENEIPYTLVQGIEGDRLASAKKGLESI